MSNPSNIPANRQYVLVTPARNEERFIAATIEAVAHQTVPPTLWVIVDDGSTDGTGRIALEKARIHPFIQVLQVPPRPPGQNTRSFGSKAAAFRKGYEKVSHIPYAYIGNLDADITFDPNYYERMMIEMERNSKLGVCTGVCWDKTDTGFKLMTITHNHAVGAVQFFRKECFEQIGGYRPTSVGGVDSMAVLMSRMHGWDTRCFDGVPVYHHKPLDSANSKSASHVCLRAGMTEYHIGSHPLFALAKAARRWRDRPLFLSVFIRLYGYAKLWFSGVQRDAPPELVRYLKSEQLEVLRKAFTGGGFQR